jgi:hypothetical protein
MHFVDILKKRKYVDTRGFHPLLPTPNKIFIGRVKLGQKKISEIWRLFPIPTGVATAAGRSTRSVVKFGKYPYFQDRFISIFNKAKKTKKNCP